MLINELAYNPRTGKFAKIDGSPLHVERLRLNAYTKDSEPLNASLSVPIVESLRSDIVAHLKVISDTIHPEVFYTGDKRYIYQDTYVGSYSIDCNWSKFQANHPPIIKSPDVRKVIRFFGYDDVFDFLKVLFDAQECGKLNFKSILACCKDGKGSIVITIVGNVFAALGYNSRRELFFVLDTMQKEFDELFSYQFAEGDVTKRDFHKFDCLQFKFRIY